MLAALWQKRQMSNDNNDKNNDNLAVYMLMVLFNLSAYGTG